MTDGDAGLDGADFEATGTGIGPYAVREFTSETGSYAIRYAPRYGVLIWTDRDYGPAACPVTEWLCVPCETVHPWQEGDRLSRPCPRCGSAMLPTSPSVRMLEQLRTEADALRRGRPESAPGAKPADGDNVTVSRHDLAYVLISVPDGSRKASWERLSGLAGSSPLRSQSGP